MQSPKAGADWIPTRRATRFRLWAPVCREVVLELLDPAGRTPRHALPMIREPAEAGYWSLELSDAEPGTRYRYRLLTDRGGRFVAPDPRSRWQPDGPAGASQVIDPTAFPWERAERSWRGPGSIAGLGPICELHVGTFTRPGTFDAIDDKMLARLCDAGYRSIELMPVHCFPGRRNWGYDPVLLFSPPPAYGPPDALRALVQRAHAAGLAIGLDVVYNHFGPESNYHGWFGPYQEDHGTPWGPRLRVEEPHVLEFVTDNARMWINEYHFDFLRLDQTHFISDPALLAIGNAVRDVWPHGLIIAEDHGRRLRLTRARAEGGIELDAQWNLQFHHVVMGTIFRRSLYSMPYDADSFVAVLDRGLLHWDDPITPTDLKMAAGQAARMVDYMASHDEIGNFGGTRLARQLSAADYRLVTALTLLSPGIPMFFMGDEYAEDAPFAFFADMTEQAVVAALRRDNPKALLPATFQAAKLDPAKAGQPGPCRDALIWFKTVTHLRQQEPALRQADFARLHVTRGHLPAGAPLVGLLFEPPTAAARHIWLLVNLEAKELTGAGLIGIPPGRWQLLFSSHEPPADAGSRRSPAGPLLSTGATLAIPPRSISVFAEVSGSVAP